MGRAGRRTIRALFDTETNVKVLASLFRSATARPEPGYETDTRWTREYV
jgi:hypothetical protein